MKFKFILLFCFSVVLFGTNLSYSESVYESTILPMTSNSSSQGTAFSSGNDYFPVFKAFDGIEYYRDAKDYRSWAVNGTSGFIGFEYNTPEVVNAYSISTNLPGYDYATNVTANPGSWTFEAWDGKEWKILDSQKIHKWTDFSKEVFSIENNIAYKKYRLNIESNSGAFGGQIQLVVHELQLLRKKQLPSPLILEVKNDVDTFNIGNEFAVNLTIDNISDIAAEDITLVYDTKYVQLLNVEENSKFKVVKKILSDGKIRLIIASKGSANLIMKKEVLALLKFRALTVGSSKIEIVKGKISDGISMEKDLNLDQCGLFKFSILGAEDVNKDGTFTLLDLAIDARYMYTDPKLLPQYNTDIVSNNQIDEEDLTEIANRILLNNN